MSAANSAIEITRNFAYPALRAYNLLPSGCCVLSYVCKIQHRYAGDDIKETFTPATASTTARSLPDYNQPFIGLDKGLYCWRHLPNDIASLFSIWSFTNTVKCELFTQLHTTLSYLHVTTMIALSVTEFLNWTPLVALFT